MCGRIGAGLRRLPVSAEFYADRFGVVAVPSPEQWVGCACVGGSDTSPRAPALHNDFNEGRAWRCAGGRTPLATPAVTPRKERSTVRKPLRLVALGAVLVAAIAFPAAASAVTPGTYTGTLNPANAPSGTHLQSGTIECVVSSTLSVSCPSYELAGVGNTNATVSLAATYSATIDCTNNGGNLVESHTTTFSVSSTATVASTKNGRLTIPSRSANPFSAPQVCPNPNWTPSIRAGTLVLESLTYTVTFAGFTSPAISITATDP
jgi:hypothetical protein